MASSDFIKRQKGSYKKLKPCFCPAIQETVYFTSDGLNHLLYDRRRPRSAKEKYYRASLIPQLTKVITEATTTTKAIQSKNPLTITWVLSYEVKADTGKKTIKVILIKRGAGKVQFLSAMRKKSNHNSTS
jgi:hypothetical protein